VRIPGLRVIARTSSFAFAGKEDDVRRISARLGATWLLEGSIRRDGQRVRVSAQLVSGRDGMHAWSRSYDRQVSDLFAIQDDIARTIAEELKLTIAPRHQASQPIGDPEAYDLWVRGRSISQQYTPEALAEAERCYQAAIARDPGFSRPWFGMADLLLYARQFGLSPEPDLLSRARQAVVRSIEIDDQFGEAHALLGTLQGMLDYDWSGAGASFERALRLSPGSAKIRSEHAWYHLTPQRQFERAVAESQQAVTLDPLSPFAHGIFGLILICARDYGRAVEECRTAVRLAPGLWWLHWFYGSALLAHGRMVSGLRECKKVYDGIHDPLVVGLMAGLYGLFFQRKKAKALLAELQEISRTTSVSPFAFAFAYLGLGDGRVFEWLDKAIDARDPIATHLPSMPFYDGIRGDRRFDALLGRMNLARQP
jgi:tetratricopeptide (TPR) repeat protein